MEEAGIRELMAATIHKIPVILLAAKTVEQEQQQEQQELKQAKVQAMTELQGNSNPMKVLPASIPKKLLHNRKNLQGQAVNQVFPPSRRAKARPTAGKLEPLMWLNHKN
jgi:hypothetical protein